MKTTPLPWVVNEAGMEGCEYFQILLGSWDIDSGADGKGVAHCRFSASSYERNKANAEFIVHACNNHYNLVSALNEVSRELAQISDQETCDHEVGICWCSVHKALDWAK